MTRAPFPEPPRIYLYGSQAPTNADSDWFVRGDGLGLEGGASGPLDPLDPETLTLRIMAKVGHLPEYLRRGCPVAVTQAITQQPPTGDEQTETVTVFRGRVARVASLESTRKGYVGVEITAVDNLATFDDVYISPDWDQTPTHERVDDLKQAILSEGYVLDTGIGGGESQLPLRVGSIKARTATDRTLSHVGVSYKLFDGTPYDAETPEILHRDTLTQDHYGLTVGTQGWKLFPRVSSIPASSVSADLEWTQAPGDVITAVNWSGLDVEKFNDEPESNTDTTELGTTLADTATVATYGRQAVRVTSWLEQIHRGLGRDEFVDDDRREIAEDWFIVPGGAWQLSTVQIVDTAPVSGFTMARILSNRTRPTVTVYLHGIQVETPDGLINRYSGAATGWSLSWDRRKGMWLAEIALHDVLPRLEPDEKWTFQDLADSDNDEFATATAADLEASAANPGADADDPNEYRLTLHDFERIAK